MERLRQIPRETGKFITLLASGTPDGRCIEIGTSAGYSTLWLSLACQNTGRKIVTFEILEAKALLARETFRVAGIEQVVQLVLGDCATASITIPRCELLFLGCRERDLLRLL